MPVHNRFEVSQEAVDSVYAQTYRPIELIIVDDLSDEPFIPQINSEENFAVKVIRHDENKGPGASRETGRQAANGEYIAYLDSDDLWHPEKLEKQVAMLEANPETGMCYCQSVIFSELPITGKERIRNRSEKAYSSFLPTIYKGRPWSSSTCLWRQETSDLIGTWPNAKAWEDIAYDFRAGCLDVTISYVPEILCYQRWGGNHNNFSRASYKTTKYLRVPALLSMADDFIKFDLSDDAEIYKYIETLIFRNNMTMFQYGEREIGKRYLNRLLRLSKGKKNHYRYRILNYLHYFLPTKLLSRIGRKFVDL